MKKIQSGFTLIELMIIGILAAIATRFRIMDLVRAKVPAMSVS